MSLKEDVSNIGKYYEDYFEERSRIIADWNAENTPVVEDHSEEGATLGVFHISGQWYYGYKNKRYDPFKLVHVPDLVFEAHEHVTNEEG